MAQLLRLRTLLAIYNAREAVLSDNHLVVKLEQHVDF